MIKRYTSVASYLHWLIATAIIVLLISGWSLYFELWNSKTLIFQLFQWHKSIGITVLLLVLLRVVWRFTHTPPALPTQLIAQHSVIKKGHFLLYVLMLLMPLSGWVLVSTSPQGIPTIVFGLFEWLHLPLPRKAFNVAELIHFYAAIVISFVAIVHVSMAIKHQTHGIKILQRLCLSRGNTIALAATIIVLLILSINMFLQGSFNQIDTDNISTIGISADSEKAEAVDSSVMNKIGFTGEHAGRVFKGFFSQWQLDTDIDFESQKMSYFDLSVEANSVATGSSLNDRTLLEYDWFNVDEYPMITYSADSAEFISNTEVKIIGQFTIKDRQVPLNFLMTYENDLMKTKFIVKRRDFDLGQESDPDAEWVSEEIVIQAQSILQ